MLKRLLRTWDLTMRHVAVEVPVLGRQVWTPVLDGRFVHLDWTYARRDDDFWQRSRALFDGPDAMSGVGENSHDQGRTWEHDYDISWVRAS